MILIVPQRENHKTRMSCYTHSAEKSHATPDHRENSTVNSAYYDIQGTVKIESFHPDIFTNDCLGKYYTLYDKCAAGSVSIHAVYRYKRYIVICDIVTNGVYCTTSENRTLSYTHLEVMDCRCQNRSLPKSPIEAIWIGKK